MQNIAKTAKIESFEDEVLVLFRRIYQVCRKHGFSRVEHIVRRIEAEDVELIPDLSWEIREFVLEAVCSAYKITKNQIFGVCRGSISDARTIAMILIVKHTAYTGREVSKQFSRRASHHQRILACWKKMEENASSIPPHEKKMLSTFGEIDIKIIEYIKSKVQ